MVDKCVDVLCQAPVATTDFLKQLVETGHLDSFSGGFAPEEKVLGELSSCGVELGEKFDQTLQPRSEG